MSTARVPEGRWFLHGRRMATSLVGLLAVAVVPKCPVCITAWLVTLGLGAGAAQASAPFVRPAAWVVMSTAILALALGVWSNIRRPRRSPPPRGSQKTAGSGVAARFGFSCGRDRNPRASSSVSFTISRSTTVRTGWSSRDGVTRPRADLPGPRSAKST